jgi:secondary thiamine-phosphate synthase enzyme
MQTFALATQRNGLHDITAQVQTALAQSTIEDGLLLVSVPHSTAAITVAAHQDPLALEDIDDEIRRLVPTREDFKHQIDTPQDAAGHVKAALVGHSRTLGVDAGRLLLSVSQKIFLWEFDAPRQRTVHVKVIGR